MPILKNARHERFAQEIAKGKSATEAYELVGFAPNRHNAAALARREHIITRCGEIQAKIDAVEQKATEKAVQSLALTKEWVLGRLVENVNRGLQAKAMLGEDGEPVGEYKYDGNVVNRALELIGKELRMFVDRKEVGGPGEFEGLSIDALRERIAREIGALGADDLTASLAGGMSEAGKLVH